MTRLIPAALRAHLAEPATTTTRLLKVTLKNGFQYGLAMLDRDVLYDDNGGPINYVATNGFDPATLSADIGYTVANTEGYALISDAVPGVTLEMVNAGELDDATWICYLVNFADLSMGHIVLDAGDLGEVRTRYGLVWIPELLSYIMRLRQPVGSVWSRQCRAIHGTPANSQTGCGINIVPLWVTGEVVAIGAESNRVYTGDDPIGSPAPVPGRVQWLTGANAGKEFAIEAIEGDEVTLSEPTPYLIEVGDQYRRRENCGKQYRRDCIGRWNNGPNFKGEPYIPVGDSSAVQAPGAQLGRGAGFIGERLINPGETN